MDYTYGQFDGKSFPTPYSLFPSPQLVQFILMHGQEALDHLGEHGEPEVKGLVEQLMAAGLLEVDDSNGTLRLTPRMVHGMEHRALLEIFAGLKTGSRDGHPAESYGPSDDRSDGSRPYHFGDKLSELDMHATLRSAMSRLANQGSVSPTPPLHLSAADLEIYQTESRSDVALCVLLDMSGSMMRYGRFYQAKRVALGMAALMRRQFPQDSVDFVGFHSTADVIAARDLPLIMPKPVSIFDYQVRLRVALDQVARGEVKIPEHFTNLQLGLRLARQVLRRRGGQNKQIFVITDGQPTAHVEQPGDMLHLVYPPSERTSGLTLQEALRCQQEGIRLATFALIEDYWGMDWVGFVDQLTRLVRGTAFYCSSDDLSSTVIESYLAGKRRKSSIA